MTTNEKKIIGNRIKQARKSRGLSQVELAQRCQWSDGQTRISNYENGKRMPTLIDIRAIAAALDLNKDWLADVIALTSGEEKTNYVEEEFGGKVIRAFKPISNFEPFTGQVYECKPVAADRFIMLADESMNAADGYSSGTVLGFKSTSSPVPGAVMLFSKDGELMVGQYFQQERGFLIHFFSPARIDLKVIDPDTVKILGRLISVTHSIK